MNEAGLRQFINSEIQEFNQAICSISNAVAEASDGEDPVPLELEKIKEFLNLANQDNPSLLLIYELLDSIKQITKAQENDLCDAISDMDATREELFSTLSDYKNSCVATVSNKFSVLRNKTHDGFDQCKAALDSTPTDRAALEHWNSDLAKMEQELIDCYGEVRTWTEGTIPADVRIAMDQISHDVKALTDKINQMLSQDDEEETGSSHGSEVSSHQSVKSAVARARAQVKALQQKRENSSQLNQKTNTAVELLSTHSHSHQSYESVAAAKELATTIAQTISDSMALARVPVPDLYTFYGDPLEYADWEIAFSAAVDKKGITEPEKMRHLQRCLGGEARKTVQRYFRLRSPNATQQAREALRERFGDDFKISDAYKQELEKWPKIASKDYRNLREFSEFLLQCLTTIQDVPALGSLNDWSEIKKIVDKLPDWLTNNWKRKVNAFKTKHKVYPKLKDLAEFVKQETEISCTDVNSTNKEDVPSKPTTRMKKTTALSVQSKVGADNKEKPSEPNNKPQTQKFCYHCSMTNHNTVECGILRKKNRTDVVKMVQEKRLCYGCLRPHHSVKQCHNRATCAKCAKRHPTCLHMDENPDKPKEPEVTVETCGRIIGPIPEMDTFTSAMIVPVWVSHKDRPHDEVLTYAMLDTQSSSTFMLDSLFETLKCPATKTKLTLTTLTSKKETTDSLKITDLRVRGYRLDKKLALPPTYTRQFIPFDKEHVPTGRKTAAWPHLCGIQSELEELFECDAGLLIGYDCTSALAPLETVKAEGNLPYAVKTELGWSIVGTIDQRESADRLGVSHRVITKEVESGRAFTFECDTQVKEKNLPLGTEIIKVLETDFSDVKDQGKSVSLEDRKFLQQLSDNIHQDDDDYVTMPLPFRTRPTNLPDNTSMAQRRLQLLAKRFTRDNEYKEQYHEFINNLLRQGHAEEAPDDGKKGQTWLLPHFGVFHPKKPGKIRVVFDGSAKFKGQSINDHLLQGPDLMNTLLGILLRFRAKNIAIMCDIEKMFHQFRVVEADRDYFRFMWGDTDMKETKQYRMTVHLFGATSSPGCATYGLRYLAEKYQDTYPKASQFIQRSFYVDDGLTSVDNEEEAEELIKSATDLCKKGNIHLHKFVSNSKDVLETIPPTERSQNLHEVTIAENSMQLERALGVLWCVETDTFRFTMSVPDRAPTRRGVLSIIASVYDPLGFLAPFVVVGKGILQELCRRKIGWDDEIPTDVTPNWMKWVSGLLELTKVQIPRSTAMEGDIISSEIHCFADASTTGYGVCAYLRQKNERDEVTCNFLLGKSRVAPLKMITIPRMELQAAVTATQLAGVLERELKDTLKTPPDIYYWTDSEIVLSYISNDAKKFKIFVANRVQQIRDSSEPGQWHHVASEENPADYASRGAEVKEIIPNWITAPEFLQTPNLNIPKPNHRNVNQDDPEVRNLSVSV